MNKLNLIEDNVMYIFLLFNHDIKIKLKTY
jgi:hypothetical protein